MRAVVLVLVGLAGLKIWTHEQIFRSAAENALIGAYRDRAIEACHKDTAKDRRKDNRGGASAALVANPWANPAAVHLVIGRSDVDVAIWDVDNALWAVRYRYPQIVLDGNAQSGELTCRYDVTLGTATVKRGRS